MSKVSESIPSTGEQASPQIPIFLRRNFLIDVRQWRPMLLVTGLALVLLVLVNLAVYKVWSLESRAILDRSPELERAVFQNDRAQLLLLIGGSAVLLLGVFLMAMFESHKTAGAAFNLNRNLRRIAKGEYGHQVLLRRDDNLKALASTFNEMSTALECQLLEDTETLAHLAEEAEGIVDAEGARALALRLADEAERRRRAAARGLTGKNP